MFCGWPKSSLPGGLAKAHKPERQEPPGSTLKADLAAKISHVYEATGSNWPLSPSWQGSGSPSASTCAASPRASHWSRPSRSDVTRRAPSPITHSSRSSVTRGIPGAPLARSERTTAPMAFRSESGTRDPGGGRRTAEVRIRRRLLPAVCRGLHPAGPHVLLRPVADLRAQYLAAQDHGGLRLWPDLRAVLPAGTEPRRRRGRPRDLPPGGQERPAAHHRLHVRTCHRLSGTHDRQLPTAHAVWLHRGCQRGNPWHPGPRLWVPVQLLHDQRPVRPVSPGAPA